MIGSISVFLLVKQRLLSKYGCLVALVQSEDIAGGSCNMERCARDLDPSTTSLGTDGKSGISLCIVASCGSSDSKSSTTISSFTVTADRLCDGSCFGTAAAACTCTELSSSGPDRDTLFLTSALEMQLPIVNTFDHG